MRVSVVSVDDKYFLAFTEDGLTSVLCDANTGNGLRCTREGALHIRAGANCSAPLSFEDTEPVDYPNEIDSEILIESCSLDGDMMDMIMRLEFGSYVARGHERLVLVDGVGSYLIPEWEVSEQ